MNNPALVVQNTTTNADTTRSTQHGGLTCNLAGRHSDLTLGDAPIIAAKTASPSQPLEAQHTMSWSSSHVPAVALAAHESIESRYASVQAAHPASAKQACPSAGHAMELVDVVRTLLVCCTEKASASASAPAANRVLATRRARRAPAELIASTRTILLPLLFLFLLRVLAAEVKQKQAWEGDHRTHIRDKFSTAFFVRDVNAIHSAKRLGGHHHAATGTYIQSQIRSM